MVPSTAMDIITQLTTSRGFWKRSIASTPTQTATPPKSSALMYPPTLRVCASCEPCFTRYTTIMATRVAPVSVNTCPASARSARLWEITPPNHFSDKYHCGNAENDPVSLHLTPTILWCSTTIKMTVCHVTPPLVYCK